MLPGANSRQPKVVVVSGAVGSRLDRGAAVASLGVLLKSHSIRLTCMKIDPYLNVDAGTMSPFERGEIYVLDDGAEVDLDIGNYERFLDLNLTGNHSLTSGKIYEQVIKRERAGEYLGKPVRVVPHVSDAIQDWIMDVACTPDATGLTPEVCLVELCAHVCDIESSVYLEALRQLQKKLGPSNFLLVHLGCVPTGIQEPSRRSESDSTESAAHTKDSIERITHSTRLTQQSMRVLRDAKLRLDLFLCRCDQPLDALLREKLSLFLNLKVTDIISLHNLRSIFRFPPLLVAQNVGEIVCSKLELPGKIHAIAPVLGGISFAPEHTSSTEPARDERLADWLKMEKRAASITHGVRIAIVGKYTNLQDSYMSVIKALRHACIEAGLRLELGWVESTELEPNAQMAYSDSNTPSPKLDLRAGSASPSLTTQSEIKYSEAWRRLKAAQGVLIPGGFGNRGIEGMIIATKYCRENKIPFFGISVGFQVAVIEAVRSLLNLEEANSTEFDEQTKHPCVVFVPEGHAHGGKLGGTMRLGSRMTIISTSSLAYKLYDCQTVIYERHRHRYEVNLAYVPELERHGFKFTGKDERGKRMEIMELTGHPFFFNVQFHSEFRSRPHRPSPPFLGLVLAAAKALHKRLECNRGALCVTSGFLRPMHAC